MSTKSPNGKRNTFVSEPHFATIPKLAVSHIEVLRVTSEIALSTLETDSEHKSGVTNSASDFRTVALIALTVEPGQALPKGAIRIHLADVPSAEGDKSRTYLNQKGLASETASVTMNRFSSVALEDLEAP